MAAKWQTWMPLYIDRFLGSADVQMMEPAAFKAYVRLLLSAWQSDDCTVPSDADQLAVLSGLGRRLWDRHCSEVIRKFVTVSVTVSDTVTVRLRNEVEFGLWSEAKRIHEARKRAATDTNCTRSPKRSPSTKEERSAVRSPQRSPAHNNSPLQTQEQGQGEIPPTPLSEPEPTITAAVSESSYDPCADPSENIPEGLSTIQYAIFVLQECAIPAGYALKVKVGDAIGMLAKEENCGLPEATKRLLDRMRSAAKDGPVKWLFWLEDGGWKQREAAEVSTEGLE